jgi:hypothetical protein
MSAVVKRGDPRLSGEIPIQLITGDLEVSGEAPFAAAGDLPEPG